MCLAPISVFNPHYSTRNYQYLQGEVHELSPRFVSQKRYIEVPCGKCFECRQSYFNSIEQRAIMESKTSYVFFCTLTYDNDHIPSIQFTTDEGKIVDLYYSDVTHIQDLIKRMRSEPWLQDRGFRYLAATEFGSQKFRPHHHILFFIAKLPTDHPYNTALNLEKQLKESVLRFYGKNVGTRKNPVYEPYFTYVTQEIHGKQYSSFDLQLVRDRKKDERDPAALNSQDAVERSITYLLSYVNKPSRYEQIIEKYLTSLGYFLDPATFRRLKRLVGGRVYYSKHLGFGYYADGSKVTPTIQCIPVSNRRLEADTIINQLPAQYIDFVNEMPGLAYRVNQYMKVWYSIINIYFPLDVKNYEAKKHRGGCIHTESHPDRWKYPTFSHWLDAQNTDDFTLFYIMFKYFPKFIQSTINSLPVSSEGFFPSLLPKVYDDSYKQSYTYKYIRQNLERGLLTNNPYLCFAKGDRYIPLCGYFRKYCTTFQDVERLYDRLHIKDLDDYMSKIVDDPTRRQKVRDAQHNNADTHEQNHKIKGDIYKNLLVSKIMSIFMPRISHKLFNKVK